MLVNMMATAEILMRLCSFMQSGQETRYQGEDDGVHELEGPRGVEAGVVGGAETDGEELGDVTTIGGVMIAFLSCVRLTFRKVGYLIRVESRLKY